MATGETGFDDVTFDLISVQYHALKAGNDYGQYLRDAKNARKEEIASFSDRVMRDDVERALTCPRSLAEWGGTGITGPQSCPQPFRGPSPSRGGRPEVVSAPKPSLESGRKQL